MDRPRKPFQVLIVEDEALLALDIEAIVEDAGHEVCGEAMSLSEVKALRDEIDPVLAFVDLNLGDGSSGLEVCRYIRKQWPRATIIFVTANATELPDDFAGGHGVIPKPFSHVGMTAALRYLEQAISDPPPRHALPASLTPSSAFLEAIHA